MNRLFLVLVMFSCFCTSHVMYSSLFRDIATHESISNILSAKPKPKNELKPELEGANKMLDTSNSKVFFIEDSGSQTGVCCLAKDAVKIPKFKEAMKQDMYSYAITSYSTVLVYKQILSCMEAKTYLAACTHSQEQAAIKVNLNNIVRWTEENNCFNQLVTHMAILCEQSKDEMRKELLGYKQEARPVLDQPKKTGDGARKKTNPKSTDRQSKTPPQQPDIKKSFSFNQFRKNSGYFSYFTNHPYVTFGCIAVLSAAISVWYFKDSFNLSFLSSQK